MTSHFFKKQSGSSSSRGSLPSVAPLPDEHARAPFSEPSVGEHALALSSEPSVGEHARAPSSGPEFDSARIPLPSSSSRPDDDNFHLGPVDIEVETASAIRRDYYHASHVSRLARSLPDAGQYLPKYSVSEPRPPLPLVARQDALNHARLHPIQLAKYNDLRSAVKKRFDNVRAEIRRQHPGLDHVPRTGRGGADPESYFQPDKRVILKWNEQGVPCDAWSVPFNRYIGCLVKRSDIFNPWYLWKYQPFSSLESAWRNLEVDHYVMDHPNAWKYVMGKIKKSLQEHKGKLKAVWEKWDNDLDRFWRLDNRADPPQFAALCYYWESEAGQKRSESAKANRAMHEITHHGGSRSFARWEEQNNLTRVDDLVRQVYGTFSPKYNKDELKAKKVKMVDELTSKVQETILSQTQSDEESGNILVLSVAEQDRIVDDVMGPSKKNRYRLRGSCAQRQSTAEGSSGSVSGPNTVQNTWASHDDIVKMREEIAEERRARKRDLTGFLKAMEILEPSVRAQVVQKFRENLDDSVDEDEAEESETNDLGTSGGNETNTQDED